MSEESPLAAALWTLLNVGMGAIALIGGSTFLVDLWKHQKGKPRVEVVPVKPEPDVVSGLGPDATWGSSRGDIASPWRAGGPPSFGSEP